jgi:hypothetical protein
LAGFTDGEAISAISTSIPKLNSLSIDTSAQKTPVRKARIFYNLCAYRTLRQIKPDIEGPLLAQSGRRPLQMSAFRSKADIETRWGRAYSKPYASVQRTAPLISFR